MHVPGLYCLNKFYFSEVLVRWGFYWYFWHNLLISAVKRTVCMAVIPICTRDVNWSDTLQSGCRQNSVISSTIKCTIINGCWLSWYSSQLSFSSASFACMVTVLVIQQHRKKNWYYPHVVSLEWQYTCSFNENKHSGLHKLTTLSGALILYCF